MRVLRYHIAFLMVVFGLFSCSKSTKSTVKTERIVHSTSKQHPKIDKKKEQKSDRIILTPKVELAEKSDSLDYLRRKYAPLLSAKQEDILNLSLYKLVDEWMGAPYKYGGNSKTGTDCSGFTGVIYNHIFDISLARRAADIYHKTDQKLKKEELKEGDLVFFDIGRRELSHVGVYLTNGKFVHASTSKGVVISDLEMDYYKKYFRCGGRIINQ